MGSRTRNSTGSPPPRGRNSDLNQGASRDRVAAIAAGLADAWPDAVVELDHDNAYQLLVATILAAQSTDKLINTVTPALFARFPDPAALARVDQAELEPMIFSTGFYRMKAKNVIAMARRVVDKYGGKIPTTMEELVDLPGVARKTANVVLGSALGKNEGVVVDTHVTRLAGRLGLTEHTDPVKIEQDLMRLIPRDQWSIFAHRLIWHGRRVCHAKKPDCDHCGLAPLCPSAGLAGQAIDGAAAPLPKSARRRLGALAAAAASASSSAEGARPAPLASKPPNGNRSAPLAGKPPSGNRTAPLAGKPPSGNRPALALPGKSAKPTSAVAVRGKPAKPGRPGRPLREGRA